MLERGRIWFGAAAAMVALSAVLSVRLCADERQTVRAVVIGGVVETGLWGALAERFEKQTGCHVELVSSGVKRDIAAEFRQGKADLITMHASDTIIHLVADGYAVNPQPWLKNDLVIVGPADDPAGIRGMKEAGEALRKIRESGSMFVVHSSLGAQEVLRGVLDHAKVDLDPEKTVMIFPDKSRLVLKVAAEKHAYTLVGRVPFLDGKLPNEGLVLMVKGDPILRRPYVVATANKARFPSAQVELAGRLSNFMREEATQQWIAEFGRGVLDEQPIFFRVEATAPPSR